MSVGNPWLCIGALAAFAAGAGGAMSACGTSSSNGGYGTGASSGSIGSGTASGASSSGGPGSSGGVDNGLGTSSNGTGGTAGGTAGTAGGAGGPGTTSSSGGNGNGNTSSSGSASTSSSGSGGTASSGGGPVGDGGAPGGGSLCLQAGTGDYSKTGPYAVSTLSVDLADAGLSGASSPTTFTIYYPTTFTPGCEHPITAWGNGTGVSGQGYAFFSQNLASWGVVNIASDNPDVAGSPYLSTGINYLIAQNNNSSSPFYHHLSTKAGVAGHSQGGIAATSATTMNSNVISEVCVEGGGGPKAGTSVLCLTGSITDGGLNPVNLGVVQQTYPATTGPAFLADWDGGDHVTTPTGAGWFMQNPGTIQFVRLMTAWFRCFLASDEHACTLFQGGANCGICKDPGWYLLESKNVP